MSRPPRPPRLRRRFRPHPALWQRAFAPALSPQSWLIALIVAAANFGLWALYFAPTPAPDVPARVAGLSYAPFQRGDDPGLARFPSDDDITRDLKLAAALTPRIRTYASAQFPAMPDIAARHGLHVTAGIWLTGQAISDDSEIAAGVSAASRPGTSVARLIVGNETLLKKVFNAQQLGATLQRVKAQVKVPISTAEPWHIWLANPLLAEQVDFITIHLLPYWEGIAPFNAVGHAMFQLDTVKRRFPNKPVLIGEIGWPSNGERIGNARATPANQAAFIREFLATASARNLDYFLMEATDQPWKVREEGYAGGYWGLLDASRQAKFAFAGPVQLDPYWHWKAGASSVLGFVLLWCFLMRLTTLRALAKVSFAIAAQLIVVGAVLSITAPFSAYLRPTDWVAMAIFVPTLLVMATILLAHAFEFVEIFWDGSLRRSFAPRPLPVGSTEPWVSIHLACSNEPPDMVIATLKSLAKLRYTNFEVLVIDNNTADAAQWQPVAGFVDALPEHFKFFHLASWPGFKAGALNFALARSNPAAEIVAVVDADYQVEPDWLASLVGYFADPTVGVVQSPQANREWGGHLFRRMMNWEYDGFFRIGMHHRNERNAIVQHGTMTLIQANALRAHGAWSEWCVCEDTELGLRLMQRGMSTIYVDHVFGRGLTPDGFAAFKKQRRRWAQGGMQIFKAHFAALLKSGQLSGGQRYHFLAGWLPWVGDAFHLIFALAAVAWTVGAVLFPHEVTLPTMLFMLPLATFVVAKLVVGPLLYWRRVSCSMADIVGASIAGMAVSHGIARGVISGLLGRTARFDVTDKGAAHGTEVSHGLSAVREEAAMWLLLASAAALLVLSSGAGGNASRMSPNVVLWIAMLGLQSLPYVAALVCMWLSTLPERRAAALTPMQANL